MSFIGIGIGIVSISSIVPQEQFVAGTNALAAAGFAVKVAANVTGPEVAPAEERARLLEEMWLDPEVDLLLFSRGGQGAEDVVPLLDWEKLDKRPNMPVIGFSDVTILLNAMLKKGVGHPVSGPMLSYSKRLTPDARDWFMSVLSGNSLPEVATRRLKSKAPETAEVAKCFPMGGHVTRMHWLWEHGLAPSALNRVVFLESSARPSAGEIRADLEAMRDGGFFDGAAGVVFCSFSQSGADGEAVARFIPEFAATLPCPVFEGFPYGHVNGILAIDFLRPLSISSDGALQFLP